MKWLVAAWVLVSACGTTGEVVEDGPSYEWLEARTDVRVTMQALPLEEREAMFGLWWPESVPWQRWRITIQTGALPEGAVVKLAYIRLFKGESFHDYSEPAKIYNITASHSVYDPGDEPAREDYAAITVTPERPTPGQTGAGWQILGALGLGLIGPQEGSAGITKQEAIEFTENLRAKARARDDKRIAEWRVAKARYESYVRTIAMLPTVDGCTSDRPGGDLVLEVGGTCTWISDGTYDQREYGDSHELKILIEVIGLSKESKFLSARIWLDESDLDEQLRAHGPLILGGSR